MAYPYPPTSTADPLAGEEAGEALMTGTSAGQGDHHEHDEEEEVIDEVRRYEDFSTVDWIQDALHERTARAKLDVRPDSVIGRLDKSSGAVGYIWRWLRYVLEEGQTWVVITLVGVGIGISAALISIITVWLSDMKLGYCTTGWWLSRKYCCLEVSDEFEGCAEWRNWGGVEPFRWIAYILFAALFSATAAFTVRSFAPYAAGSGISEIKCILAGFVIKGFLGAETFFIKGLTLPLAIASGLSVGKEGPSVHVACAIGNVVARFFDRYDRSHLKMREIVTASSAAGVAVAFGSPIGGVLFSIEEMNQTFSNRTMWQSFVCALVATFTLASMDPFRTGKLVLFQVSYDRVWHYFELPFYILIGIFGGLYGAFVIKFNLQMASFRRKHLANHGIAEAVTLAVLTAVIGYLNRFLRIDMTESMEILFRECEGGGDYDGLCQTSAQWRMVNSLLIAVIVRTAMIVVSYGCKVPCGIFVPSMAVGALFGRMVGILVKAMHTTFPSAPWFAVCAPDAPCITPGTYAFLGAAAALGGVTRLTVTVVVIMFELTGALTYVLPVMITLLVTKAVSDQFGGQGIADQMIKFNGYPFLEKEDKEDGDAFIEPIANVMKRDLVLMYASGMELPHIEEIVQSTTFQGFPVVRSPEDLTVIGFMRKAELRYALERARRLRNLAPNALCTFQCLDREGELESGPIPQADIVIPEDPARLQGGATPRSPTFRRESARRTSGIEADRVDFGQYVDETPLTVAPKMPLEIVMQLFRRMGPRVILVCSAGQLQGLVTVKDVLRHEARHEAAHQRRLRNGMGSNGGSGRESPLPEGRSSPGPGRDSITSPRAFLRGDRGHRSNLSTSSSTAWGESWAPVDDHSTSGVNRNGFEVVLEEGLKWVQDKWAMRPNVLRGPIGRRIGAGGGGGGFRMGSSPNSHEAAYEFDLSDDRPS